MPDFVRVNDKSHIGGMDTVLDARADTFPQTKCLLLRNAFPGDPPVPRNSVQDVLVDIDPLGKGGTLHTLFKPPCLVVRAPDGTLFAFVCNTYYDSDIPKHQVEMWDVKGVAREAVCQLYDPFGYELFFGLLPLYNAVFVYTDKAHSAEVGGSGTRQKVVEWNADSAKYVSRSAWIAQEASFVSASVQPSGDNNGLTSGLWVSYRRSYVRRSDDAAFTAGEPIKVPTFSPGDLEGAIGGDAMTGVEINDESEYEWGDATTELVCEEQSDGVFKYTWPGAGHGTDPQYDTAKGDPAKSLEPGDYIDVRSNEHKLVNTGIFKLREVGADYFIVDNEDGIDDEVEHPMTAGGVKLKFAKVQIALPAAPELAAAIAYGATHYRLYRSDHAATEEIAKGLIHRFLVDLPISGSHFAATWEDTISRASLLGESNYATLQNYTEPPNGRYAAFGEQRVFVSGDPEKRGRMWYTEVPGGDGGTSFAQDFPKKYATMFNLNTYWVDFDPDDGQIDTGLMVFRDDLYFFKEKKVFMLRNADVSQAPDRVSESIGCMFPNTLLVCTVPEVGEILFFISNIGPAFIMPGGSVRLVREYSIEQLWPNGELLNIAAGDFMTDHVRERVYAKYHNDTVWVLYGDSEDDSEENVLTDNHIWGWHVSSNRPFAGCLEVTFGNFTTAFHVAKAVAAAKGTHALMGRENHFTTAVVAIKGEHTTKIDDSVTYAHSVTTVSAVKGTHTPQSGTCITDNFSGGTMDSWWNADFRNNNYVTTIDGDYALVGNSDDRATPAGTPITGDFDLKLYFKFDVQSVNKSMHLGVRQYDDGSERIDTFWNDHYFYEQFAGSTKDTEPYPFVKYATGALRITREGSTIKAYYDKGSGWEQFSYEDTYSDDIYVQVDTATWHGITSLQFSADGGFPYTPPQCSGA